MKELRVSDEVIFIGSENDCNAIAAVYDKNKISYEII